MTIKKNPGAGGAARGMQDKPSSQDNIYNRLPLAQRPIFMIELTIGGGVMVTASEGSFELTEIPATYAEFYEACVSALHRPPPTWVRINWQDIRQWRDAP